MGKLSQQNLYAFNILNARRTKLDEEYSFLISAILHIESELEFGTADISQFSQKVLEIVNSSGAFRTLDRVCLSISHPGSSRISVKSSFNSNRLESNGMDIGYSCFVSPGSSLFQTKKSNIRIYSDIDLIISRYEGKPVQRSLMRLKKMGVKSGMAIPLTISHLVSGFLFLNSKEEGTFDELSGEDYAFLCLLKLCALSCLHKSLYGVNSLDGRLEKLLTDREVGTNRYNNGHFQTLLSTILSKHFMREVAVSIENSISHDFLFATKPTAYTIVKCLETCKNIPETLRVEVSDVSRGGDKFIELRLKGVSMRIDELAFLQNLGMFMNQDIGMNGGDFYLMMPFDSGVFEYSV